MSNTVRWLLSVSGGIVVSLAWWEMPVWLLLVCFVPLLFIEDDIQNNGEPVFSLFPYSFVFFLLWNLIACWWIARINIPGGMGVIILNSLFMSMVFLFYSRIKRSMGGGPVIFVILWISFEFLHYRGDLSWPWLSLGNGLAGNIKLIQWYEFTGTTGGSLWILLVNALLFIVIKSFSRQGRTTVNYLLSLLLVILIVVPPAMSLHIYKTYSEKEEGIRFLIIQPALDPYEDKYKGTPNSERLDHLLNLADHNIDKGISYIVTPETSVDSIWITDNSDALSMQVYNYLEQYPGTGIVLGATSFSQVHRKGNSYTVRIDEQGQCFEVYNSALFYFDGGPLMVYNKHYLANGVEQIPFQNIFRVLGRLALDLGGVSGSMKKGPGQQVIRSPLSDSALLGPLICLESAYGEYTAGIVKKGAEILIIITNDGWFRNTGAYMQHLRLSQIRAVETRRSVVRAATTGISCHISQRGEIIDQLGWWEEGALQVTVNRNDKITFFSLNGDYPGRAALFFSVLIVLNLLINIRLNSR